MNHGAPFTAKEDQYLTENYQTSETAAMAKKLGRTLASTQNRLRHLDLRKRSSTKPAQTKTSIFFDNDLLALIRERAQTAHLSMSACVQELVRLMLCGKRGERERRSDFSIRRARRGPYGDPFVVKESWAEWQRNVWIQALAESGYAPQHVAWVPTFEPGTVMWPGNDGKMQTAALDQYECPTRETADHLAALYAAEGKPLHVEEHPFVGPGPVVSTAVTRLLQWPNMATLPVKQLAIYYALNPESSFPHVADNLCKLLIARVWPGA